MRLLIAGASGRTGRLLTARALEAGHEVTALVRDETRLSIRDDRLRIVRGDVLAPETLPAAMERQDAVISLLAPRPRTDGRVYTEGTRHLTETAVRAGVRRFVAVSAEGAGVDPHLLAPAYRAVLRIPVVARLYPDIARMEDELRARNDLDWTVVRPPILTNGRVRGAYRTALGPVVPRGLRLSRGDLAEFLLKVAESDSYSRARVSIAY